MDIWRDNNAFQIRSFVGPMNMLASAKNTICAGASAMIRAMSEGSQSSDLLLDMLRRPRGKRSPGGGKSIGVPALNTARVACVARSPCLLSMRLISIGDTNDD